MCSDAKEMDGWVKEKPEEKAARRRSDVKYEDSR